jgi:hypothetical protein
MNKSLLSNVSRVLTSFVFSFTLISHSFGQGKSVESFVISPKGDSIKGFVRYEGWELSPQTIEFTQTRDSPFERMGPDLVAAFYLVPLQERYVSKKIGILNIDLSKEYAQAPSFEAKDSATLYLREITSGPKAVLFEYLDATETAHYFLEKDGRLTELLNYPFYKVVNGKKYLIQYDEYKRQLTRLLSDNADMGSIPGYSARELGKYVNRYNGVSGKSERKQKNSAESEMQIDVYPMVGMEGWKETGFDLGSTPTFGVGLRISMPRRFHNRYFRIQYSTIRGISTREVYKDSLDEKMSLNTLELGIGNYIGSGDIRPNLGIDYSFPMDSWRATIFGPHIGISFRRTLNLEVSHFANFGSLFSDVTFFNRPRVSLSYYLNLNKLFRSRD